MRGLVRFARKVLWTLADGQSLIQLGFFYLFDGPHAVERLIFRRGRHQSRFLLELLGAKIGADCDLEDSLEFHHSDAKFGRLTIGDRVHIGKSVFIDLAEPVVIERNATISMRCMILTHIDVGQSPLATMGYPNRQSGVRIGEGAYLGAGVIVLPGVSIGKCAVVGAGAVVNRDLEPCTVNVGVPARIQRRIRADEPGSS